MQEKQHEFKVTIDGIALTEKQRESINTAIQQAVLAQMDTLRLREAIVTRLQDHPGGIAIGPRGK